jgi:hypothetical protein
MNHRHQPKRFRQKMKTTYRNISEGAGKRCSARRQTTRLAACLAFFFPFFNTKAIAALLVLNEDLGAKVPF